MHESTRQAHEDPSRAIRLLAAVAAVVVLAALATTNAFASSGGSTTAFSLPPAKQCVSGQVLTFQLRKTAHVRWVGGSVKVNGASVKTIERSQVTRPVQVKGLPLGRIVLTVTAVSSRGRSVTVTRTYRTCAAKPVKPTPTPTPVPKPVKPGKPTTTPPSGPPSSPSAPSSSPQPGSYRARTSSYEFAFYVSPDGTQLQDVALAGLGVRCAPGGGTFGNQFYVPEINVKADGSFSATRSEEGDVAGAPATFTYSFSGQFAGGTAAGAMREDVSYDNGVSYSCTSNVITWSATRDVQPSQALSPPEPGSYRARTSSYEFAFYVSPDGTQLQDVALAGLSVRCAPGGGTFGNQFYVPEIEIKADGSFSATRSEEGDVAGTPAEFSFTFSGHFHGHNSSGRARIAGVLREDVTYGNGAGYSCTSNVVTWSAIRDEQPSQAASPPVPGSYTARTSSYEFPFSVAADGSRLQNVSLAGLSVRCAPGGGTFGVSFHLAEVAIDADGSFAATTSGTGVVSGAPATFTYTFSGHFHGYNSSGHPRIAGALRADVTYDDGISHTCSSNIVSFSATH